MNVRPYQPGDRERISYRTGDRVSSMHEALLTHGSFMRVVEIDGEPVALLGLVVRWPGVADVWAVVTDGARGHGLALTRRVRQLVDEFCLELGLWRLSAYVHAQRSEYARWLELVGFECEGVEEYGAPDGKDLLRYRLLWTPPRHLLQS